jgi:hypothetical protein
MKRNNYLKGKIELIYRIAFIIICATGVFIHFDLNDKNINIHEFSFFTLWSNIFCLVFMIVLLIKHFSGQNTRSHILIYFKGMALSCITCTFLVYHFSGSKIINSYDHMTPLGLPLESILAHYVVPFMFILDWILFQPKGLYKWSHIFSWLLFPLVYIICFFTRCRCNNPEAFKYVPKYPYFFLNYENIGFKMCLCYILVLLVIFIAINVLIVLVDKLLYRRAKEKKYG